MWKLCENIIVAFLNLIFLFISFSFIHMFIYIFFPLFFFSTHVFFTFSLSSLLTFLYTFLLHQNILEDQASRIRPLSFQNIPFLFSLSLLTSTHSVTQPTPTHFFILIFTSNLGRRWRRKKKEEEDEEDWFGSVKRNIYLQQHGSDCVAARRRGLFLKMRWEEAVTF